MSAGAATAHRPPAVPLCLSVGFTGHRDVIDADGQLRARLTDILRRLRDAAAELNGTFGFAPEPLRARFVCPLAEGGDQIAAAAALDLGYDLHAVLPFRRHDYPADFGRAESGAILADLLTRADRVLELPCRRGDVPSAYALAGRATVAHCDVLVALWDGLPARGPGGTGEVVEQALRHGLPVIHVSIDPHHPARIVWTAHEPHLLQSRLDEVASRELDDGSYTSMVLRLIAPPINREERARLAGFYGERERRFKPRIEYPLLLAVTGVVPVRRASIIAAPYSLADDRPPGAPGAPVTLDRGVWRSALGWSDGLAAHFAQSYRSGHVFNFFAGALAVLLGLSGLVIPAVKLWLAFAELAVIGAFILNTRVGVARNWHRRWLDYRQLAERLRAMASLAALGVAQPERQPVARRAISWVDWYAAGMWRSIGMPDGELAADVVTLTHTVIAREIMTQVAYHANSSVTVHRLDHRLHRAGTFLFAVSCLSCAAFIVAYLIDHDWTVAHAPDFVALSAGLPAIGTAFFGIRVQGDFAGTAARSGITSEHLAAVAAALEAEPAALSRTADGLETVARAMVADLGEWRLSHQQRQLELA